MNKINSYTNWGRLEEVWLGDCYPAHFYDHLESEVRDVFYDITQKTQEDLAVIHRKLEEFNVVVRRPYYDCIENFVLPAAHPASAGHLRKPCICPRDNFLVFGNTLYGALQDFGPWSGPVTEYSQDAANCVITHPDILLARHINGANTVRVGRDLYLDTLVPIGSKNIPYVKDLFKDYRLHLVANGGHLDACFAVLKPGLLMANNYFTNYELTFPGWAKINIPRPGHGNTPNMSHKWYWPTGNTESIKFNDHVIKHAQDWVGDYTETYFEINCLVIDEKNVLMLGENDSVFRELEQYGITAHSLPLRTRTFWDGGLHCITLDIRRQDSMIDLFPDRVENLYRYY